MPALWDIAGQRKQAKDNAAWNKRVNDPFRDVPRAQELAREGVTAYGEMLQPYLADEIGKTLGGLNEIGALRSGGTKVALDDINMKYADRIGAFASGATLDAIGIGRDATDSRVRRELGVEEIRNSKAARRGQFLSDLGGLIGSGIGFWSGGGFGGGGKSGKA